MAPNNSAEGLHPYTCAGCDQESSTEELYHHNKVHAGSSISLSDSEEKLSHIPDEDLKIDSIIDDLDLREKVSRQQDGVITRVTATHHVGIPTPSSSHAAAVSKSDLIVSESFESSSSMTSMLSGTSAGSRESLPQVLEAPPEPQNDTYPRKYSYNHAAACEPRSVGSSLEDDELKRAFNSGMFDAEHSDDDDDFGFDRGYGF